MGRVCSGEHVGAYGVSLLKTIRRGWGKFCSHTRFDVGDGSKVRFRHNLWCGDMVLKVKDVFSILFGIACANDASVATQVEFSGCTI
jgi:hypothetical protein